MASIICIILIFLFIDSIFTALFSEIEKKRYLNLKKYIETHQSEENIYSENAIHEQEVGKLRLVARNVLDFYDGWVRYKLRLLGKIPCHFIRNMMLKNIYKMKIGKNVTIYGGFEIRAPWNISIGEGTIIGDESKLDGRNEIEIGCNVNLSTGVWIWTEQHDPDDPYFRSNGHGGKVVISNRVWLSSRVCVLPKVVIGEGTVVAAGAVVTKNCEQYCIYGGIPAKKIGYRNKKLLYEFDGKHEPFY